MISKHTLIALVISSLCFLTFHLFMVNKKLEDVESKCIIVSSTLCVESKTNSDTIKNINLSKYKIDPNKYKIGDEVVYSVQPAETNRKILYGIAVLISLLIFILIRFPVIIGFVPDLDL